MNANMRPMSGMIKEMAELLLKDPQGLPTTQAFELASVIAGIGWNEAIGIDIDRGVFWKGFEVIESENPKVWEELKSRDVDAMVHALITHKKQHWPQDRRRIFATHFEGEKIMVKWLPKAKAGEDPRHDITLWGMVNAGEVKQAIEFLCKTKGLSRGEALQKTAAIARALIGESQSPAKPRAKRSVVKRKSPGVGMGTGGDIAFAGIAELLERFCKEKLNEEYGVVCRKMAEKLARKRPSPLASGSAQVWASGIVRTVGWVNFLHDKSQKPYMRAGDIDAYFGVGESTGAAKSGAIRKLLKINHFDSQWMLPSKMAENPMIWMLKVNGIIIDMRKAPRPLQAMAFQKGLIPFIPGDEENG